MSDDALDRRLHDLLDGRLSPQERADLESRLRDDPALAARLEAFREIGDALRGDAAALPPGFYTRARARFEADQAGRSRWFRPLSWEGLGVAAAALLALALFVPLWLDRAGPLDTTVRPAREPERRGAGPGGTDRDDAVVSAGTAPEAGAFAPAQPAPPAAPATTGAGGLEQNETGREQRLPAVRAEAPRAAPAPEHDGFRASDESQGARVVPDAPREAESATVEVHHATAPEQERGDELAAILALAERAEPFAARAMPAPYLERDAVLVLDDLYALPRRNTGVAEPESSAPAAPAAAQSTDPATAQATKEEQRAARKKANTPVRWLLIGPRAAPFACAGFKIAAEGDAWVIALAPPDADNLAAPYGCVLTLPRDGKSVRVTGP